MEKLKSRGALYLTGACAAAAAFLLILNLHLPLVRNGITYSYSALAVLEHDFRIWEVLSDPKQVGVQAAGFSVIAAPFIGPLGLAAAAKTASFLGTLFFFFAVVHFFIHFNKRFEIPSGHLAVQVFLSIFSPLVFYQSWSAYPDSWFAGFFVMAITALDKCAMGTGTRGAAWLYFFCTFMCIFLKNQGLFCVFVHPVYAACAWKFEGGGFWRGFTGARGLITAWIALSALVVLELLDLNPIFYFGGGYQEYARPVDYLKNVREFLLGVILSFSVTLVALAGRVRIAPRHIALIAGTAVYILLVMNYWAAGYNMRQYLAVLPMMALAVSGALSRFWGRGFLIFTFAILNFALIAGFNTRTGWKYIRPYLYIPRALAHLDNFRMDEILETKATLDAVNTLLPENSELIWFSSYTNLRSRRIYKESGYFRPDIKVVYPDKLPPAGGAEQSYYLFHHGRIAPEYEAAAAQAGAQRITKQLFYFRGPG